MSVSRSITWRNETRQHAKRRSLLPSCRSRAGLEVLEERALLAVFHVSLTGDDGNVGSAAAPFRTVQHAINAAAVSDDGDDVVKVQAGTYDTPQDLGFSVPSDDEIDSLDILGSYDPTFNTSDPLLTPTNYLPQNAGGSITLGDEGTTLANFKFAFDGTNNGIVLAAGEIDLVGLDISNATHGIIGDGITGAVRLSNSSITGNSSSGLTITNHHGDVSITNTSIQENATGFKITSATSLTIADLTLQENGEPNDAGGTLTGVYQLYFTATSGPTNDFVLVTGASSTHTLQYGNPPTTTQFTSGNITITHTRAGGSQQPIYTTNDIFHIEIDGGDGDDTISVNGAFLYDSTLLTFGGPYGGLHVFGGEGNDLLLSTGVTARKSTSSVPVPHFFYGEGGNDTFSVLTGSGYDDILEVDGYTVLVWHGPDPQDKSPGHYEYRDIETLDLFTAGGNDVIRVNEPATGPFPSTVNISTQDENDGIEINLGRPDTNTSFNIDGGDGTNGLTVFTRSANDNELTISIGQLLVRPRSPSNLNAVKTILHSQVRGLTALADAGNDTFRVEGSFLGNDLRVLSLYGQDDNDLLDYFLLDPGLASFIQFHGGGGQENQIDVVGLGHFVEGLAINDERIEMPTFAPSFYSTDFVEYHNVQVLRIATGDYAEAISISRRTGPFNLPRSIQISTAGGDDDVLVDLEGSYNNAELRIDLGSGDDDLTAFLPLYSSALQYATLFITGGASLDERNTFYVHADPVDDGVATVGTFSSNELMRVQNINRLIMSGGDGDDLFTNNTAIDSILDGLRGDDTLIGGSGRDLLLGEGGADLLKGDDGEDLLVSGPVTYDHHFQTLLEVFEQWIAAAPFSDRVANLRDNEYLVPGGNVFDEGSVDTLMGGNNADWLVSEVPRDDAREEVEFVLDSAQSYLDLSGTVQSTDGVLSVTIRPQLPESLHGRLQGQITASYSEDSFQILPDTDVDIIEQPDAFLPGNLPADLAAMIAFPEGYAAFRDIHFSGRSSFVDISGSSFRADRIQVFYRAGIAAVDVIGVLTQDFDVVQFPSSNNARFGRLERSGSNLDLTLPIDTTSNLPISGQFAATLRIQGTIVARGTLPADEDFVTEIVNEP